MRRLRAPRLETLFCSALVLFGFGLGVRSIRDNSALTHIRTGIEMARGSGIPRADPYSFTAGGEPWVVQSWLAELIYGWAFRIGDLRLVVILQAILMALVAWLITRLARTGSALRTALAAGTAVALGAIYWSPRPLMFGLLCLALTITVVERRLTPWLLVPVVWLWVNTHGSFPLGLVWLVARAVGEYRDWRTWPRETSGYVWAFLGGLVASTLNPLGARLLTFPLSAVEKSATFRDITEWRSPNFQSSLGRMALVFLVVALVMLLRARISWRDALPVAVFVGAGLLAVRNVAPAAIVLAPVLARAIRPGPDAVVGAGRGINRLNRMFAGVIGAGFAVFALSAFTGDSVSLERYPVDAAEVLYADGELPAGFRLAHQDIVGNYLIFRYGRSAQVFIDDRYDMYPEELSEDYADLLRLAGDPFEVLDKHEIDAVLWGEDRPLTRLLDVHAGWERSYSDADWVIFERVAGASS